MLRILSNVLGSRNSESSEHILHIRTATEMMLRQLLKTTDAYHLTETDIAIITTASSLHDIGKIRIPEEILNKPGRLTDEEFNDLDKALEQLPVQGFRGHVEFQGGTMADWGKRK